MHYDAYQPEWGPVTHATYQREPYVRATLADGTTVDGKASAWTQDYVLVTYVVGHTYHNVWVHASLVQRIKRSESAWIDVYDDYEHYANE